MYILISKHLLCFILAELLFKFKVIESYWKNSKPESFN